MNLGKLYILILTLERGGTPLNTERGSHFLTNNHHCHSTDATVSKNDLLHCVKSTFEVSAAC